MNCEETSHQNGRIYKCSRKAVFKIKDNEGKCRYYCMQHLKTKLDGRKNNGGNLK